MGVSWVFQCPIPDPGGRTIAQVIADYEKHLLTQGALRCGTLSVDSEPFFPNTCIPGLTSTIHLCHYSDFPLTSFVLVTEAQGQMPYMVADRAFDQLLTKMNTAFIARPNLKVECKGQKYSLADFTIKMCSVLIGGNAKGLLVEVEYNCCSVPSLCSNLMKEVCSTLFGATGQQPLIYFTKFKDCQSYAPVDTVSQYLNFFLKLRTTTTTGLQSVASQPLL